MTSYIPQELLINVSVADSVDSAQDIWDDWVATGGDIENPFINYLTSDRQSILTSIEMVDSAGSNWDETFSFCSHYNTFYIPKVSAFTFESVDLTPYSSVASEKPISVCRFAFSWFDNQTAFGDQGVWQYATSGARRGVFCTTVLDSGGTTTVAIKIEAGSITIALTAIDEDREFTFLQIDDSSDSLVTSDTISTVQAGNTKVFTIDLNYIGTGAFSIGSIDLASIFAPTGVAEAEVVGVSETDLESLFSFESVAVHSISAKGLMPISDFFAFLGVAFNSSLEVIGSTNIYYTMEITDGSTITEVPISSWQATIQSDRQSYAQCVVPAVSDYASVITSGTSFTIYRKAVAPNGTIIQNEMLTSPIQSRSFSRGPQRYTCTISGYSDAFDGAGSPTPIDAQGVRSITDSNGSYRIRCDIDWVLRPNNVLRYDGTQFTVAFINYYVNATDSYMDVGDR